ncbi:MAG: dihydroorotase [Solirubrobacteraceae bacterium]
MNLDLVIRNGTLVIPRVGTRAGDIGVRDGKIAAIEEPGSGLDAPEVIDATGLHVFPGSIDPHAHIALGGGGGLDEYRSETGAAALGGVTSIYYMMMTGGSYDDLLAEHDAVASASAHIDYGFHPTLMTQQHVDEVELIRERWGVRSCKYFMHFRGDEGKYLGVEGTHDGMLYLMLKKLAATGDVLMIHAENPEVVWVLRDELKASGRDDLAAWDDVRPPFVEAEAIAKASYFANHLGCDVYFVHVSTAESLDEIRTVRTRYADLPIAAETCPHYLTHSTDSDVGVLGKVNPPLRRPEHLEALWAAIQDGTIDTLGSDHVARLRSSKVGSIWDVSAGFPCAPLTMPVLISEGFHERGIPLERIAELTSKRPAELMRCAASKGDLQVGLDADLALIDLETARSVDAGWLGTYSDYSLYEGWDLRGWSRHTFVRGEAVVRDGELVGTPGHGAPIRPSIDAAVPAA